MLLCLFGWHEFHPVFALWTSTSAFPVPSESGMPIPFLSLSILRYYRVAAFPLYSNTADTHLENSLILAEHY